MRRTRDPRFFQIATLSSLLVYGVLGPGIGVAPATIAATVAGAVSAQWLWTRVARLPGFDPASALISSLSLCLLLRANHPALAAAAAALAISSKFLLRYGDRHIFNPTAFAIVTLLVASDAVWVSPGQWGTGVFFAFLLAAAGALVVHRAERSDVTLSFVAAYGGLVVLRAAWLGDPLTLPLHHLENGAFVLFAFFMISDPKTTPDSRRGRVVFAALVALGAFAVHFVLFEPNGMIWALVAAAPLTPLINRWLPGPRYQWRARPDSHFGTLPERSFA